MELVYNNTIIALLLADNPALAILCNKLLSLTEAWNMIIYYN